MSVPRAVLGWSVICGCGITLLYSVRLLYCSCVLSVVCMSMLRVYSSRCLGLVCDCDITLSYSDWLLYLSCVLSVVCMPMLRVCSSRCLGFVCDLWLWDYLVILSPVVLLQLCSFCGVYVYVTCLFLALSWVGL